MMMARCTHHTRVELLVVGGCRDGNRRFELDVDDSTSLELLQMQVLSVTGLEPADQVIVGLRDGPVVGAKEGSDPLPFEEGQRLVVFHARLGSCAVSDDPHGHATVVDAPDDAGPSEVGLEYQNQAIRAAVGELTAKLGPAATAGCQRVFGSILSSIGTVRRYDRPDAKLEALAAVPVVRLWSEARTACLRARQAAGLVADSADTTRRPSARALQLACAAGASRDVYFRDALLGAIVGWFKHGFFRWANAPACSSCGKATVGAGAVEPTAEERRHLAGITEVYRCSDAACGAMTRFPRYNDAVKLLSTKCGRCGEWANTFTLVALATGFDARYIHDFTDHVWTEVWSAGQQRWFHVDSCEATIDRPLMYESGWKKKLTYIFAIGRDGAVDVTRYVDVCGLSSVLSSHSLLDETHGH